MYTKNVIQRLLIVILVIAIIVIVFVTKDPVWYGIGMVYVIVFFLLSPLLFWCVGQQRGKVSLLAAYMFLILDKISPTALKTSTGIYFELAAQLFSQVRVNTSHWHKQKTQREIEFLRKAPEMRLAKQLYQKAQNLERQFIEIDPEDRFIHELNVAVADEELGYLYRCQHHFDEAVQYFKNAAVLLRELRDLNPRDAIATESLAASIYRLAEIDHVQGKYEQAKKGYKEAEALFGEAKNKKEREKSIGKDTFSELNIEEEIAVVKHFLEELED